MRTTINLDDELIRRAMELSGQTERATVVRLGLEALIAQQSARRLAALGGSDGAATAPARRRSSRP
jgi:Arc/MetJ family transcription regulator